jgi:nicotinate-nucleotide adenylyltransferase
MTAARVGILGGSFNPIHVGHLIQADEARARLDLDRVLFVLAKAPPHKSAAALLDQGQREDLLRLALDGAPRFEVSRIEIEREGPSYTIDTLRDLRAAHAAGTEIHFLMGADSLIDLASWREPEEIMKLARVAVFPRAGYDPNGVSPEIRRKVTLLDAPTIEISSEAIRARIRAGRPFRYMLPHAVWRRIEERGLYRDA